MDANKQKTKHERMLVLVKQLKEADAAVKGLAEKTDGLIQADALNRKGTEAVFGNCDLRGTKCDHRHK